MLYVSRGSGTTTHQPGDRATNQERQTRLAQRVEASVAGHGRVRRVHVHQINAHHPRLRLLGRGQAVLYQTRLSDIYMASNSMIRAMEALKILYKSEQPARYN